MSTLKIVTLTQPQKIRLKNCEDCSGISAAYQNGKDVYKTELDPVTIILGIRVSETTTVSQSIRKQNQQDCRA